MKNLLSKLKSLKLEIDRVYAHGYRQLFGSPLNRFTFITPQLYLGGQYNLRGFKVILRREFTGIVNMREVSVHNLDNIDTLGVKYLHLPTKDLTAPKLEDLQKGIEFIKNEIDVGGKVYVHCKHGEGRGPSMAISYLISTGMTLVDALELVRRTRGFIRPTNVQMERLKEVEKLYLGS